MNTFSKYRKKYIGKTVRAYKVMPFSDDESDSEKPNKKSKQGSPPCFFYVLKRIFLPKDKFL